MATRLDGYVPEIAGTGYAALDAVERFDPDLSGYLANLFDLPPSLFGEHSTVNVGAVAIVLALGVVAVVGIRESAG